MTKDGKQVCVIADIKKLQKRKMLCEYEISEAGQTIQADTKQEPVPQ